jgi:alpha-ribazole phosphatase
VCPKKVSNTVTTIIDLLRHGEVEGGPCFRGSQDDPLTDCGWQQMQNTVAMESGWQSITTSPLQRCSAFASQLSSELVLPLSTDTRVQEMHFGDWEGKTAEVIMQSHPEQLGKFWEAPDKHAPPNGESYSSFKHRVLRAWDELSSEFSGQHILLITHAGCIRTILAEVLQIPSHAQFRLEIPYASLSRVKLHQEANQRFPSLVFHGK